MLWMLLALVGCRESMPPPSPPPEKDPSAAWERVLRQAVDREGHVDYERIARKRQALDAYVSWLAKPRRGGKGGANAHAYWLNAFNALVIYQVIERDVQGSVNEVPSLLPWRGSRFWYGTQFTVDGREVSLWDMGHERVTHAHQDFRDLAALHVAAVSGPPMRPQLYTPDDLGQQLDEQFSAFVGSDDGLYFDDDTVVFNQVFERYDFEIDLYTNQTDLCTIAAHFTSGRRQRRLRKAADAGCPHRYALFDWSLDRSVR